MTFKLYSDLFGLESYSSSSRSSSSRSSSSSSSYRCGVLNPNYTRENLVALPTDNTDLAINFTHKEYVDVYSNDSVYVNLEGRVASYLEFLFKDKPGVTTEPFAVTWNGSTDVAPSSFPVYLQIYNHNSTSWETLDSDTTTAINTDFTLTATISSNLSNYFDGQGYISCRVYQQIPSSSSSSSCRSSSSSSRSSSSSSRSSSSSSSCRSSSSSSSSISISSSSSSNNSSSSSRSSSSSSSSSCRSSSSSSSSCRSSSSSCRSSSSSSCRSSSSSCRSSSSSSSSCRSSSSSCRSSSSSSRAVCWVAAEIFDGWYATETINARYYILNIAPTWFKEFYIKNGKQIASFIHNKPIFKTILRPVFEYFAKIGERYRTIGKNIDGIK